MTGHDWFHLVRVHNYAMKILKHENIGDVFVIRMGALLHEIGDYKITGDIQNFEKNLWRQLDNISDSQKCDISHIIENISFRGGIKKQSSISIECQIVQDADRLDAIGAIGLARVFTYGGKKGRPIYDPDIPLQVFTSEEAYKSHLGTSINHFYEKLLTLEEQMNTSYAKFLAKEKTKFLREYLQKFFNEWESVLMEA